MRAEILLSHAEALLMGRVQDANIREVRRVTNLLLRIKRYERRMGDFERITKTVISAFHDLLEKTWVSV
jgi:hypothetical protein